MERCGRHLQVSAVAVPGVHPLLLAPGRRSPRPRHRWREQLERARLRRSDHEASRRLGHMELAKPPLRPLGPVPQRSASSTTTRASGSSSETNHAVHMPGVPAADDHHVGIDVPGQRRSRLGHPSLLEPPAVSGVPLRHVRSTGRVEGSDSSRCERPGRSRPRLRAPARTRGSRAAPSARAGRCAARRWGGGGATSRPGRGPRRWCCPRGSARGRPASRLRMRGSWTGVTSSTRL